MLKPWIVTATHLGVDRILDPIADDVAIEDQPKKDAPLLYDRSLTSDLTLSGEDFDWLRAIDPCDEVTVRVERGAFSISGIVNLNELPFEDDRCTVAINFTESSPTDCLEDNASNEVDILFNTSIVRRVVSLSAGEIETFSCGLINAVEFFPSSPTTVDASCPTPDAIGWIVTSRVINNIVASVNPGLVVGDVTIVYSRLVFDEGGAVPPGDGWTLISGTKYGRSPTISTSQQDGSAASGSVVYTAEAYSSDTEIDNTFLLNDVIDYFVAECGLAGWTSVFLGRNAPAIADNAIYDATVYDWAYTYCHNIMLAQKSDVKRIGDFQNATKAPLSWEKVLTLLKILNLQYGYNPITGNLIIEHKSFFAGTLGLDVTVSPYADHTVGLSVLEGRGAELPGKTNFAWMDGTTIIFDGYPIIYDCGDAADPEDIVTADFTSNIEAMLGNSSAIDDLGFAVMACSLSGGIYSMTNTTSAAFPALSPINGAFSLPNIHDTLWRDQANHPTGRLNDVATVFNSTAPQNKTDVEILIKFSDYINFNPADLVGCRYGEWRVESAAYSDKGSGLVLSLEG